MSNANWSRSDRIALIALLVTVLSCVAAIIVIPEVRRWFGLSGSDAIQTEQSNSRQIGSEAENVNRSPREEKKIRSGSTSDPDKLAAIIVNDKNNEPEVYLEVSFSSPSSNVTNNIRIKLIDIAYYPDNKAYIKVSVCNKGFYSQSIGELYLWYTPATGQDSVNWHMPKKPSPYSRLSGEPLVSISPGECRVLGAWSENISDNWQLTQPLGKLYIGESKSSPKGFIDLGLLASKGLIQY